MLQLSKLAPGTPLEGDALVAPLASWDNFTADSFLLTVKGAPEILLPHCSHTLDPKGGPPILLTGWEKDRIAAVQEKWSRQGQRVILLARRIVRDDYLSKAKDTQSEEFGEAVDEYMTGLIVVGIVGLMDPLKPDIKHTVKYVLLFAVDIELYLTVSIGFAATLVSASSSLLVSSTARLDIMVQCNKQNA